VDRLRRIYHPLRYSKYAQSHELLISDIVDLVPTPEQLECFRELLSKPDPRYIWARQDQMARLGAAPGKPQAARIAETANWLL
jgi:hypothetical protein